MDKEIGKPVPLDVNVVCPTAYPLFDPNSTKRFGGAEVRASLFAKGLARLAHCNVTCWVDGRYFAKETNVEGIRVRPIPPRAATFRERAVRDVQQNAPWMAGFPGRRVRAWDPNLLWQIPFLGTCAMLRRVSSPLRRSLLVERPSPRPRRFIRELGGDLVCTFFANNFSADVVLSCRRRGKKSVVFVVSDHELDARYFRGSNFRGPYKEHGHLVHYALTKADAVVVQNETQAALLEERFGRRGTVIRNPIDLDTVNSDVNHGAKEFVLWVGRADTVQKRPMVCLELAKQCPSIPFCMIVNPCQPGMVEQIRAQLPPNVKMIERVPFPDIESYYQRAGLLVNTSRFEGFPNTFLQAGKYQVPILSLEVDPGRVLQRTGWGKVSDGDLSRLAEMIRTFWARPEKRATAGRAGHHYVVRCHRWEDRVRDLVHLLTHLTKCRSEPTGTALAGKG